MSATEEAPPVRAEGIEVTALPDGYIVYDSALGRVHYLNQTAAVLLELCNGRSAAAELPELLRIAYDLPAPPVAEVAACLAELRSQSLIR